MTSALDNPQKISPLVPVLRSRATAEDGGGTDSPVPLPGWEGIGEGDSRSGTNSAIQC